MADVVFTERELDVMAVLWERGPSTVREVRARLTSGLAYNTILSVLRTLEAKRYVAHTACGRAHRYYALVSRERAARHALRRLVATVFAGSREALFAQALRDSRVEAGALRRLRRLLNERLARREHVGARPAR